MAGILTVNIGAAAQQRATRQLEWLRGRPEDVIVLTETSNGPGTQLILNSFRTAGYRVIHMADPSQDRGVALVSRIKIRKHFAVEFAGITIPSRIVAVALDTDPTLVLVGVYVPSRDQTQEKIDRKRRFLASLTTALSQLTPLQRRNMVMCGDYNVIGPDHVPTYPQFLPFELELMTQLAELGLCDAHACYPTNDPGHTWVGRTGDGYRYDYHHVGSELTPRITDLQYLHETRTQPTRLTDHSAVSLKLQLDRARQVDLPSAEPRTLF